MHKIKQLISISFFTIIVNIALGQTFSPYSQYGLGIVHSNASASSLGMGGISAAISDAYNVNYVNPAALAHLQLTQFDIGLRLNSRSISNTENLPISVADGGINNLTLSFPVMKNRWGMSFGLLPYSFTNYKYTSTNTFEDLTYNTTREGKGSLYKLYLANGVQWKGLSAGINAEFIFGKIQNTLYNEFTDNNNNNGSRLVKSMSIRDIVFNAGVQYNFILTKFEERKKDKVNLEMTVGAYFAPGLKIDAYSSDYLTATALNANGTAYSVDTAIGGIFNEYNTTNVPTNIGAGINIGKKDIWNIGLDYDFKSWIKFNSPISDQGLTDEWHVKIGGSVLPDKKSTKYLNRVTYRLGGHFGKSAIIHENAGVSDFGITFGFGIPFARYKHSDRSLSNLNFAFEIGALGVNKNQKLLENYYNFTLTYTLSDLWFRKQKFD